MLDLMLFMTSMALFTAAEATLRTELAPESESLIVDRTLLSDFIDSAIAQVEALSAALEILRPVEISFWVVFNAFWVVRRDCSAVIADGFTRMLAI